jgi:hypothetical protein
LQKGGKYYTTIYSGPDNNYAASFTITATLNPGNGTRSYTFGTSMDGVALAKNEALFLSTSATISQGSGVYLTLSTSATNLDFYLQKNTKAGSNGGCYSNWFTCSATSGTPCTIYIPPCAVNPGDQWSISLNNTGLTDYPTFELNTTEIKQTSLSLNVPSNTTVIGNTYNEYTFNWAGPNGKAHHCLSL